MTPTPPPIPTELITEATRHADGLGVLLFIVAILLVGVAGWSWVREREVLMRIIVEVGNAQQKEQIKDELHVFIEACSAAFQPPLNVSQVVVPADFDRTVNELQNTTSYTSVREHVAMAKIVELEDGTTIVVLSPFLYTDAWDDQMRAYIYLHEVVHVSNKRRFPRPLTQSPTTTTLGQLYVLFDEYDANRKAFEIIDELFSSKTSRFKTFIDKNFESLFSSLVDSPKDYHKIKEEIALFRRQHIDVNQFLTNISEPFDHASKDIVYAYSYIDHYPRFKKREPDLLRSIFVNDKTLALIDFFRSKYENDDSDLLDGLHLFGEFLSNFGMRFEDTPTGAYCHVLDI